VQSYNAKLKTIFILGLSVLILSGCVKNTNLNEVQKNIPEQAASVRALAVKTKKQIKILFVGDMMFDRYIREGVSKYGNGDYNYVFAQIKDKLSGYDLVVGNLEGPITDKSSVSVGTAMDDKKNLKFTFDPAVAKALADSNIKLVDLGNNHILNQGEEGLTQTKKYLDEAGVQYFGDAGADESRTLVKNIGGTKIGFVNYNYSVAGSFEKAIKDIEVLKKKSDIVVVCPHWGTEYKVGDPGQKIRNEAYKFIDAGADLIVGGHPHVIQLSEYHRNKKTYYSLGNFIFDQYFQKETMEGLGVELTVDSDLTMEFSEVKFEMTKKGQTTAK
jgi:poly-gamma-glutamate synthesis protein (capsule biosynthesis protein)